MTEASLARGYLAAQAAAGALWWIAVFASDDVRRWTMGDIDPGVLAGPDLVLFAGASAVAAATGDRRVALVAAAWTTAVTVGLAVYGLVERTAGWGVISMTVASVATVAATATLWHGRLPVRWFFVGPFSFRVARERSSAGHVRRSLVQLVVFWTTFFVVIPFVAAVVERRLRLGWPALDEPWCDGAGAVIFLLASAVGVWSCVTMAVHGAGTPLPAETARHLVVTGPYRWVRNPMALAGGVQTAGVGLWHGSWLVIAMAVGGGVVWHLCIRPTEEADMAARFGPSYAAYCAEVRCWIPRLTRR